MNLWRIGWMQDFILIDQFLRKNFKLGAILGAPPVVQIPISIKFGTLIVKAMANFMAYNRTDSSVVHCIVRLQIEEGRLQNRRWEDNFVMKRVVVSIYRLGGYAPFLAVYRGAYLGEFKLLAKFRNRLKIGDQIVGNDGQIGIVTPLIGVTNFSRELVELL